MKTMPSTRSAFSVVHAALVVVGLAVMLLVAPLLAMPAAGAAAVQEGPPLAGGVEPAAPLGVGDTTLYLPLVLYMPLPADTVFYDDFSDPSSGWPTTTYLDICSMGYSAGEVYRVTVTKFNAQCIIPNLVQEPESVNGTFTVRLRRITAHDRPVLYGFIFGAGENAFRDRWLLEAFPQKLSDFGNKPFFWLSAREGNKDKYLKAKSTDALVRDTGEWNELTVVRNGSSIKVYINGELKGDYGDAGYLLDKGYFNLYVKSAYDDTSSSRPVVVEFDVVHIRSSTAPLSAAAGAYSAEGVELEADIEGAPLPEDVLPPEEPVEDWPWP